MALCVAAAVALCAAAELTGDLARDYAAFAQRHRPGAGAAELEARFPNFAKAHRLVSRINECYRAGGAGCTYWARLTETADMTTAERLRYRGLPGLTARPALARAPAARAWAQPTHAVDWRAKGVVTPVRDQGQCGSCWAFSATEQMESYAAQQGAPLTEFSVEEVVDCDSDCYGCDGCWPNYAMEWVKTAKGGKIAREADWPYADGSGFQNQCQRPANDTRPDAAVAMGAVVNVTAGDAAAVYQALYRGPVSAALYAASMCFENYAGGVFTCAGCDCTEESDHAIQLVGLGFDANSSQWFYWLRNSWGTTWGEQGYMQFSASMGDLANIQDNVVFIAPPAKTE